MHRRVRFDKSVDIQKAELQRERETKERQRSNADFLRDFCDRNLGNEPPNADLICPEEPCPPSVSRSVFSRSMWSGIPDVPSVPAFGPIGSGRPSRNGFNDSSSSRLFSSSAMSSRTPPNFVNSFNINRSSALTESATRRVGESHKTALCNEWRATKTCSYGDTCRYAHGVEELRLPAQANPHYKTTLCRNFALDGTCAHGARCKFVHRRDPHHPDNQTSTVHTRNRFATSYQIFSGGLAPSPPKPAKNAEGYNIWKMPAFHSSMTISSPKKSTPLFRPMHRLDPDF